MPSVFRLKEDGPLCSLRHLNFDMDERFLYIAIF